MRNQKQQDMLDLREKGVRSAIRNNHHFLGNTWATQVHYYRRAVQAEGEEDGHRAFGINSAGSPYEQRLSPYPTHDERVLVSHPKSPPITHRELPRKKCGQSTDYCPWY